MRRHLLLALAVTAGISTAACGDGGDGDGSGDESAAAVTIAMSEFEPQHLEVDAGTTVRWTNEDAFEHTVTAGTPGAPSEEFDQALPDQGSEFEFRFDDTGTFQYFCQRHPSMTAEVVVS